MKTIALELLLKCQSITPFLLSSPFLFSSSSHIHSISLFSSLSATGGMFEAFSIKPGIVVTLVLIVVFLSVGWIFALKNFSRPIVYLTEIVKVACCGWVAMETNDSGLRAVMLVCAALIVLFMIKNRSKLDFAAKLIAHSAVALKENPAMFVGLVAFKGLYVLHAFAFVTFVTRSFEVYEVQKGDELSYGVEDQCTIVQASWANSAVNFFCISWLWAIYYYQLARLSIVSYVIGSWHFHPQDKPSVSTAIKQTLTKSTGTLSILALALAIIEYIKKNSKVKCWHIFCPPVLAVSAILCCVWCLIEQLVKMLTKFTLIIHVFSGLPFWASAKKCYHVMTRHFVNGAITEYTSVSVITLGAYVFSIAITFTCWAWLDAEFDWHTLDGMNGNSVLLYVWFLWILFACWYPVLGLFFIILINRFLKMDFMEDQCDLNGVGTRCQEYWVSPLASIFVGCIAMLFFRYMGGIILDCINVMFVCFAIDKDNKIDRPNDEFYILIKDIDGLYDYDPNADAMAQPVGQPMPQQSQQQQGLQQPQYQPLLQMNAPNNGMPLAPAYAGQPMEPMQIQPGQVSVGQPLAMDVVVGEPVKDKESIV
jgi:hypothetical protein